MFPHVSFRKFDPYSSEDCALMAKWENDPLIRSLFQVFRDEISFARVATVESISQNYKPAEDNPTEQSFMIMYEGKPVGEMSFYLDRRPILTAKSNTAWAGIVIGEAHARGCGVGRLAMQELEARAKKAGAQRIELGVFEFNKTAIRFYEKLGYREFVRLPGYTWMAGKMWADIRMLKELN
ncbi:MAG: GNAT family N-acetyltransferase [Bdellovibrionota bacterium]